MYRSAVHLARMLLFARITVHAPCELLRSAAAAERGSEAVTQGSQLGRWGCHGALLPAGLIGSKCILFPLLPLGFYGCLALLPLCQGLPHLPLLCSVSFLPAVHTSCQSVNSQDWPLLLCFALWPACLHTKHIMPINAQPRLAPSCSVPSCQQTKSMMPN